MSELVDAFKCQMCAVKLEIHIDPGYGTPQDSARMAGWRIWSGQTLSGTAAEVTLCPVCAGTATPAQEVELLGWDAECLTCDARMSENWDEDSPISEEDAESWTQQHECEPCTSLIPPKAKAAVG